MSKLILYIKKFFAIIFSFIFGAFYSDKNKEKKTQVTESKNDIKKNKKVKSVKITSEDESSTKSLSTKNINIDNILYNAKKDIQKLMIIEKNIIDLEYRIKNTNNLEDLYILEKELAKEKNKLEKLAIYYDKVNDDYKIIKDIKQIVSDSRKIIKDQEKIISKKIYTEKNKIDKKEEQKEITEEQLVEEQIEDEHNLDNEVNKEKLQDNNKEKIKEIPIIELITIKEISEIIKEKGNLKQEDSKTNEDVSKDEVNKDKLEVKVEDKERKKIQKNKVFIEKDKFIKNVNEIKKSNKSKKLIMISLILAKASSLLQQANPKALLGVNPILAVNISLDINNSIRKARSLTGKKVKKLKLDKVIKKIGNNPNIMVKEVMRNSLSEIRKLKAELKQYGISDELIEALNSLNEMELNIINQIQELENTNNLNNSHVR